MSNVVWLKNYEGTNLALARKKPALSKPSPSKKRQKPLTEAEVRDARLLEAMWDRVEAERQAQNLHFSKKDMALQWGVNPSNVSQYINGHIALNIEAKLRFCAYLNLAPQKIWPDFPFKWIAPGGLPPDALEVAITYSSAPEEMKPHAKALIETLSRTGGKKGE